MFGVSNIQIVQIIFYLFCLSFFVQVFYYLFFFIRLAFYKAKTSALLSSDPHPSSPVSIIICAKNEFDNLKQNLPLVFSQEYPEFEVVVVNDGSWDGTAQFLKELLPEYKNLKVVTIDEDEIYIHGKKFALALGIKGAKHEQLLLTDADCKPASNQWLAQMQSNFSENKDIVLGVGEYEKLPGLLNMFIRFDTFFVALQYLSFALAGIPYMGVGRNLAYKKQLFFKNKGFGSHNHILSGDDDLFINEVANNKNTCIEFRKESHTISESKKTFGTWKRQKQRHLTTGVRYKLKHKLLLGLFSSSQLFFYVLFFVLLGLRFDWQIICAVFAFRLLLQLLIFYKTMSKTGVKELLLFSPLFEPCLLLLNLSFALSNLFVKQRKWN